MVYTEKLISEQADAGEREPSHRSVIPLVNLYMYIAGSCNLACKHCWITPDYVPNNQVEGKYLAFSHFEKAVKQAKPLGLRGVKLTGGEPLLHPRFQDMVQLLHHEGLRIVIETNGTLIDDKMAAFLRTHEVSFISVSLDGATAKTHDYMRSIDGSFDKAISGAKSLNKHGFRTQIICTLHRGNLDEAEDVVALAKELGCGSVKFNTLQNVGRGERMTVNSGLEIEEILELNARIENEFIPKYNIRIGIDLPLAFRPIKDLVNPTGHCGITTILGILSSGEVSLCGIGVNVPQLRFGHLATDDLASIWLDSAPLLQLRDQIPVQLEGICSNCAMRDVCKGHCIAHNYYHTQSMTAAHSFCEAADQKGLFPVSRKLN